MSNIDKKIVQEVIEDLQFGNLDEVIETLQGQEVSNELAQMDEVRTAALQGIRYHLLDSRGDGVIETAGRIRDLFKVPNSKLEAEARQGIENWTMDQGREHGEKICEMFGIPKEFMESKEVKVAEQRFFELNRQREGDLM
jgi:hypothetical protein